MGQSLFYIGSVVGTILFGFLSDKIGRLPALILSTLSGASGDFLTSFVGNLPTFAVCRFLSGTSTDTVFYLMYIMGEKKQALLLNNYNRGPARIMWNLYKFSK